ncbi:MAG: RNA methyltransferase [Acidobacteriaceae bacterium]
MLSPFESDRLCVVLVAPRNPLNIGAAARAMSNFGFLHLRVVNPYEVAFRNARSAVGAEPLLLEAVEYPSVAEAIADCSLVVGTTAVGGRQLQQPCFSLDEAAGDIRERLANERVAVLFGSEKSGLAKETLSHCHQLLRIPTRTEHRSMNLGQAVAVTLYAIARLGTAKPERPADVPTNAASAGEIERLHGVLMEVLAASGYVHPDTQAGVEEKVRSLLLRLETSSTDAELLLGMMRQIQWKLTRS